MQRDDYAALVPQLGRRTRRIARSADVLGHCSDPHDQSAALLYAVASNMGTGGAAFATDDATAATRSTIPFTGGDRDASSRMPAAIRSGSSGSTRLRVN